MMFISVYLKVVMVLLLVVNLVHSVPSTNRSNNPLSGLANNCLSKCFRSDNSNDDNDSISPSRQRISDLRRETSQAAQEMHGSIQHSEAWYNFNKQQARVLQQPRPVHVLHPGNHANQHTVDALAVRAPWNGGI